MSNEFYLILGCHGRREDNFICCHGIENCILHITPHLIDYNEMLTYFDICKLFDRPLFDYNATRSFISKMQSRFDQVKGKLFTERQFQLYHKFILEHKSCGVLIRLALQPIEIPPEPEYRIRIEPVIEN